MEGTTGAAALLTPPPGAHKASPSPKARASPKRNSASRSPGGTARAASPKPTGTTGLELAILDGPKGASKPAGILKKKPRKRPRHRAGSGRPVTQSPVALPPGNSKPVTFDAQIARDSETGAPYNTRVVKVPATDRRGLGRPAQATVAERSPTPDVRRLVKAEAARGESPLPALEWSQEPSPARAQLTAREDVRKTKALKTKKGKGKGKGKGQAKGKGKGSKSKRDAQPGPKRQGQGGGKQWTPGQFARKGARAAAGATGG